MSYATVQQFRDRYEAVPEFLGLLDAAIQKALDAATVEIDGYLPAGSWADETLVILAHRSLPLARMVLYADETLSPEHQAVRDAESVRSWLRLVAAGTVQLATAEATHAAPVVKARDPVFAGWETY